MELERINARINQLEERLEGLKADRENILKLENQKKYFSGKYWVFEDFNSEFPKKVYMKVFIVDYDDQQDVIYLIGPGFYSSFGDEPGDECFSYFSAENAIPIPRESLEDFLKCSKEITEKDFTQALKSMHREVKQVLEDLLNDESEDEEVEEPEETEEKPEE